jgi:hypothetical protein
MNGTYVNFYYKNKSVKYIGVKLVWSTDVDDDAKIESCYDKIIRQGYYCARIEYTYERQSTKHLIRLGKWYGPYNHQSTYQSYLLADQVGNVYITDFSLGYVYHLHETSRFNLKKVLPREVHKERCINVILYVELLGLGDVTQLIKQFAIQSDTPYDEKTRMAQRLAGINWHGE